MKHNITKEVKDYLNEYKPEKFYSYALFRNIYKDAEVSYESFRKVLVRLEHKGLLKSICKGIYENINGYDSDYLKNEFVNNDKGVFVDINKIVGEPNCTHNAIFTSIAGSNGLYLPDNTKVFKCDIEYNESNRNLIKILYSYKRLDFIMFVHKPALIELFKESFNIDVFITISNLLNIKESSIRFLLNLLDNN